ncbi:MAG: hypothetical protein ACI9DK_003140 [Vicingaceae bacterium]|jgi:hypothetical protein
MKKDHSLFASSPKKEFNFAAATSINSFFVLIKIEINKLLNRLSEQFEESTVIT